VTLGFLVLRKGFLKVLGSVIQAAVARHDARGSGNSVATDEDAGYFKLILDQDTQRLIGAQIVSPDAAELIQLCALAIRSRVPAGLVAGQLSVHPSRAERLLRAFGPGPHGTLHPPDGIGVVESRP
jgi:pyruvate/2-oxoglutarate dehydrogenase complex dihydrolipoamide dehydrogenase (E3) component